MLSKNQLKQIKSLHLKKFRQITGEFLVEGEKQVKELLQSGFVVKSIFTTKSNFLNLSESSHLVSETEMSKITQFKTPSALAAIALMPQTNVIPNYRGINFLIDDIKDPGNLGTIIRIADWFNINQVFVTEQTVDTFNPKVVQASMGSIFRKTPITVSGQSIVQQFIDNKIAVFTAEMDGVKLTQIKPTKNALIILGSESRGVDKAFYNFNVTKVTINRLGNAESLNVSVAAGIIANHFTLNN